MTRGECKKAYEEILSPKAWLIEEREWDPKLQQVRETQFTLGSGYICLRGVLEEIPYDSSPGTFIGGIYDATGAQITELVNLPNPLLFRIDVYGEKLDPVAMDVVHHRRTLDLHRGTLFRHTVYKTTHRKRLDYRSRRFVSLAERNMIAMEIELTPLDADMTVNAQTMIDTGISNRGVLTEGRKRHYQPVDVRRTAGVAYLCVETFEKKIRIAYASAVEVCRRGRCRLVAERAMNLRVRKGETVVFRKFVAIRSSGSEGLSGIRRATIGALRAARRKCFNRLVEEHEKAWLKKWEAADVEIEGDLDATRALRFNIYHLIIAGNADDDDVSIGARTLSGEGYRGHVFWDTEIFILPFFLYTDPAVARNLLMYRYHRLDAARHNAAAKGFEGALFPWESADTGQECTPSWAKNFDGSIIRIVTMDEELHIVGDIAYAFAHYLRAAGDTRFWWNHALEAMFETARFWASRMTFNAKRNRYEINHVMGPDEFHEDVDNNAYTNEMARWNLRTAAEWYARGKKERPAALARLARRLKLSAGEVVRWRRIADKIYFPFSKGRRLIEPFGGFFGLKEHRITQLDHHLMPVLPAAVDWSEIGKTQLIKQADVVMLLYLLGERFGLEEKRRNYYFNERRTLHKSSLSPAVHSIVGLEVGDDDRALHYFSHALSTDLSDIHGNTNEGFHAASAGGTWQAAIMGFAGMRPGERSISFNPHLPSHWRHMRFCVFWWGCRLRVSITHEKTEICLEGRPKRGRIAAEVYGITRELVPYEFVRFNAPRPAAKGRLRGRRQI